MQHDEKTTPSEEGAFTIRPEYKPKSIRSYVIRAGRMTEGQQKAFERWWPTYGLSLHDGLLDLETTFGRKAPLVIEIGFGMGDSLLEMAKNAPDTDFIGIEVHPPGVGRLINNAGLEGVKNLRVYMADAVDVLQDCFTEGTVSRCQLYFPDPWHKKKHHKRRIVQLPFVAEIRRVLAAGGHFHLATDWEDYADHMMEIMSLAPKFTNASGEYVFAEKPDYRPNTKFERRGERLGHGVWDLVFEAVDA